MLIQITSYYTHQGGHFDVVSFLISKGANVNSKDKAGKSIWRVAKGRKIKEYITKAIVAIPSNKLTMATSNTASASITHSTITTTSTSTLTTSTTTEPKSSIFKAADMGDLETVKHWILNKGKDSNTMASEMNGAGGLNRYFIGFAPLHIAARRGHLEVAKFLLDNGAMVNLFSTKTAKHSYSYTPLYLASKQGHVSVMKLLLGWWADIEKGNSGGSSPLSTASLNNRLQAVVLLIQKGAKVDSQGNHGRAPIHQESLLQNNRDTYL